MKKVKKSLWFLLIGLGFMTGNGCTETSNDNATMDSSTTTVTVSTPEKTKEEIILEGAKAGIDVTQQIIENKQKKDSALKADRKQMWVYQIGEPKNNEKSLLQSYKTLKDVRNVCVFKQGGDYFIIRKNDQSKEILYDSLGSFKKQISGIETSVQVVDIMAKCPKRKTITEGKSMIFKKEKIEVKCFVCD